jgi:hypothetical protein
MKKEFWLKALSIVMPKDKSSSILLKKKQMSTRSDA